MHLQLFNVGGLTTLTLLDSLVFFLCFFFWFPISLAFLCVFPSFPGILGIQRREKPVHFSGVSLAFSRKARVGGSGLGGWQSTVCIITEQFRSILQIGQFSMQLRTCDFVVCFSYWNPSGKQNENINVARQSSKCCGLIKIARTIKTS